MMRSVSFVSLTLTIAFVLSISGRDAAVSANAAETSVATGISDPVSPSNAGSLWQADYLAAMDLAAQRKTLLVVFFVPSNDPVWAGRLESLVVAAPGVAGKLRQCVAVKVPIGAVAKIGEENVVLSRSAAFASLRDQPGLAVIDLATTDTTRYGRVAATLPLGGFRLWRSRQVASFTQNNVRPPVSPPEPEVSSGIAWLTDYQQGMEKAAEQKKMMLILFCQPGTCQLGERFLAEASQDPVIAERLSNMVCVRLPLDAKVKADGQETSVLRHPAFAEMLGQPGLAVVDLVHKDYYGQVVSVFPFMRGRLYSSNEMRVILDLPPGTLTQRTLIYAVRTHPDRPASTSGQLSPVLLKEAESHSDYQARIRLQGHHAWETRFHRINAMLGGGMMSKEVCAESWPGQGLLESAIECVRCWRLSDGHWRAVAEPQQAYGYDMRRGSNGIWYATGIFGR